MHYFQNNTELDCDNSNFDIMSYIQLYSYIDLGWVTILRKNNLLKLLGN